MSDSERTEEILDPDVASDRARVIFMVAAADDVLGDEIRCRLVELSKTIDSEMFGDRGPLGTFSAKIDMAYALAMFGPQTRRVLHNIRRIRNRFSHLHDAISFAHPEIEKLCLKLPAPDDRSNHDLPHGFHRALVMILVKLSTLRFSGDFQRPSAPADLP